MSNMSIIYSDISNEPTDIAPSIKQIETIESEKGCNTYIYIKLFILYFKENYSKFFFFFFWKIVFDDDDENLHKYFERLSKKVEEEFERKIDY